MNLIFANIYVSISLFILAFLTIFYFVDVPLISLGINKVSIYLSIYLEKIDLKFVQKKKALVTDFIMSEELIRSAHHHY